MCSDAPPAHVPSQTARGETSTDVTATGVHPDPIDLDELYAAVKLTKKDDGE